MKDFEVIAEFTYAHEYAVLKMLLEQENIPHYFHNETILAIIPSISSIKLKVHKSDFERVLKLMEYLETNTKDFEL